MKALAQEFRISGTRIGIVPTMGALHDGHISLVKIARKYCDVIVMSLFVNPAQFGVNEDFAVYPRDFDGDCARAERAGVNVLFSPAAAEMYPADFEVYISADRLGSVLEGAVRPGHFRGMLTVVAKLFNIVQPHTAVFGQKDYQQAALITRMNRDLNFGIGIIVAPIIREPDGLAMSSRNVYLTGAQREQARALSQSLRIAEELLGRGAHLPSEIIAAMQTIILREPEAVVDYITIAHPETLAPLEELQSGGSAVIALAVRFGKTRLIDNAIVKIV